MSPEQKTPTEERATKAFFDPFPPEKFETFINCLGKTRDRFSCLKDPVFEAQKELFTFGFLPEEPKVYL